MCCLQFAYDWFIEYIPDFYRCEGEREKVKHVKMEIQAKIRIFYLFISIRQTPLDVGMRLPKRLIKVTEPSFFS